MIGIDWSKAPAGTTGAMVAHFHHPKGYGVVEFLPSAGKRENFSEHATGWVYHSKPSEWAPGALPPVGTVCEFHRNGLEWIEVEVLAHFRNSAAMVAAFIPTPDGEKHVSQAIAECFRQIRTAEQIAAEERDNAVVALTVDITVAGWKEPLMLANWLVDQGYRKQVQP